MWWKEDCLLAVAVSDEELNEEGAYKESLVQFHLEVNAETKSVKLSRK